MNDSQELSYSSHFREHLAQVRAHLAGVDGDDPPPSFIPPTGYWTPSEKNAFFHSLGIYSRLRPDLIAGSIGTKSVVDVCAYIDSLDDAIARDRRSLLPRSDLPSAHEVSNAWIQREEGMAEDIIPLETIWTRDSLVQQREEELSSWKASHTAATGLEGGADDEASEIWEHDRRRHWRREDALSKLDCHHLTVMERMLRNAEAGNVDVEDALPEDQNPEPVPSPLSDAKLSDRAPNTSFVADEMIDPVLLQLSGLPVPDQSSIKDPASQRRPEHLPLDMLAFSAASSPPPPPSAPAPLVTQPLESSRLASPVGDAESAIDHTGLSPASRRRIQKRLHMRRKRAAQRGEVVIEDHAKLRPGRKVKDSKAPKPRGKSAACRDEPVQPDGGEAEQDAQMDVDQNVGGGASPTDLMPPPEEAECDEDDGDDSDASRGHRRRTSGMTKPYKIKKDFATMGIDADTLIDRNLGLFHLSTLSKLMTFYKSGYDTKGSDAATSISADTLRLFSVILVEFVAECVHRSIVTREQEISMKSSIKVYHQTSDAITAETVARTLELMGVVVQSKEEYFAQLLGEDLEPSTTDEAAEEDEANDDEAQSEAGVGDGSSVLEKDVSELEITNAFPLLLPLHRETCPPLVWVPKSLLPRVEPRPGTVLIAEDQLMPNETDEEELLDELDDEMDLDKAEQVLAYEYEADLWKTFGR
ncbi:hypothetical protein H0H92_005352 [Tricholoma furcatifolium]|nr:hypothetical protein H0H92_005352 [Tricholoma furcatifolium]